MNTHQINKADGDLMGLKRPQWCVVWGTVHNNLLR